MNYKHGKYKGKSTATHEAWEIAAKKRKEELREQHKEIDNLQCRYGGCEKKLTSIEHLYSDYCLTHQILINQSMYKALLYRYHYGLEIWEHVRTIVISYDQFSKMQEIIDTTESKTNQPFYKYQLVAMNIPSSVVYAYNPNLFD